MQDRPHLLQAWSMLAKRKGHWWYQGTDPSPVGFTQQFGVDYTLFPPSPNYLVLESSLPLPLTTIGKPTLLISHLIMFAWNLSRGLARGRLSSKSVLHNYYSSNSMDINVHWVTSACLTRSLLIAQHVLATCWELCRGRMDLHMGQPFDVAGQAWKKKVWDKETEHFL